jgi:ankyrin repeat protein
MPLLSAQEKKEAFWLAGQIKRPRVMLALIDKREYESEEEGVYRTLAEPNNVVLNQNLADSIQAMLDLVDTHKRDRLTYDQKLYRLFWRAVSRSKLQRNDADSKKRKEFPFKVVPLEEIDRINKQRLIVRGMIQTPPLIDLIARMSMPKQVMPIGLEAAIQTGDESVVDQLLHRGCSVNNLKSNGLDSLDLAVECGQSALLRKFLQLTIYIAPQKKRALLQRARTKKEGMLLDAKLTNEQANAKEREYDQVIQVLKSELPAHRWRKNLQFKQSIARNNIGSFVEALRTGVNPNVLMRDGNPYSFQLIRANPLFLRILFRFGGNPNILVKDNDNKKFPLFAWALMQNPAITEQLVIAGVDLFAIDKAHFLNIERAILQENSDHLKVILYPKSPFQQRLNPNAPITRLKGKKYSLLYIAFFHKRPNNFQLLLDAGADPNADSPNGEPLALDLIAADDSEYLKMALNPRTPLAKKIDPNMMIASTKGIKWPFLYWVMLRNQPANFQLLLDAGADPHIGDRYCSVAYHSLFHDPKYLQMLLKSGLNPQTTFKASDTKINLTLTFWAWKHGKPQHKELLVNAGGSNNACVIS